MSTQSQMNRASTPTPDTERQMADMPTRQMPTRPMADMPSTRQMPDRMPAEGNETKGSTKTSELWVYLAAVAGVLLASYLVDTDSRGTDVFRADRAWWFISLMTIGYLGSRGLAKAASSNWRRGDR